jgi:hypothetical protein
MATAIPWTDYVSAWGSLAAILVALVGVGIASAARKQARDSASDSSRSATAAERTADSAKEISDASHKTLEAATAQLALAATERDRLEAELQRKPIVDRILLTDVVASEGDDPAIGIFRVAFGNSGTRDLTDAYLTILFVHGSSAELLTGRWGGPDQTGSQDSTRERWPGAEGVPIDLDYVVRTVTAHRGITPIQYVRIRRQGTFPLRVKLFHVDLDGGGLWADAWVDVHEDGTTHVRPVESDSPDESFAGRLIELQRD